MLFCDNVAAARLLLAVSCLAALQACRDQPSDDKGSLAVPQTVTEQPTSITDGRIRYSAGHRPVMVAPDGSRRVINSMLVVPRRLRFGDFVWHDIPLSEAPVWIRIDLARQLLSVFRGEDEIGTAVIIFGAEGRETPPGVYPILGKDRSHRSVAYGADMPFTLWLTADGVAIHASQVEQGRATHGCVGLPSEFARKLFETADVGELVIVLPA